MISKIIRTVYHWMQKHYFTFRILVWLKEKGVTRRINYLISNGNDSSLQMNPSNEMVEARRYYSKEIVIKNLERVKSYLVDDKSRDVLDACIEYRTKRIPIPYYLYSENDQYFVHDIVRLKDGEIFIDGGAYTGDTIQQLLDTAKKQHVKISKIIAFEPENDNYELLNKFYGKRSNVILKKKGLSDGRKELLFLDSGVTARVAATEDEATSKIEAVDIDSLPECSDATFIKMDIEGAEWEALHGAKKIIKKNKPKLTICIYHSDEDMIRLIDYIHSLVPEYKLYIRHHSKGSVETVVYAVI